MPNGERPISPEEMGINPDEAELTKAILKGQEPTKETKEVLETLAGKGLTEEEKIELKTLDNDPLVKEYERISIVQDFSEEQLKERAKRIEDFKKQHPELEEKLNRIKELEKKAGEGMEFISSGM